MLRNAEIEASRRRQSGAAPAQAMLSIASATVSAVAGAGIDSRTQAGLASQVRASPFPVHGMPGRAQLQDGGVGLARPLRC